jgi:hypothetical protein
MVDVLEIAKTPTSTKALHVSAVSFLVGRVRI